MNNTDEKQITCRRCPGLLFKNKGEMMIHCKKQHPFKREDVELIEMIVQDYFDDGIGEVLLSKALRERKDIVELRDRIGEPALRSQVQRVKRLVAKKLRQETRQGEKDFERGDDHFKLGPEPELGPMHTSDEEEEAPANSGGEIHVVEIPVEIPVNVPELLARVPAVELLYLGFQRLAEQLDRIEQTLRVLSTVPPKTAASNPSVIKTTYQDLTPPKVPSDRPIQVAVVGDFSRDQQNNIAIAIGAKADIVFVDSEKNGNIPRADWVFLQTGAGHKWRCKAEGKVATHRIVSSMGGASNMIQRIYDVLSRQ